MSLLNFRQHLKIAFLIAGSVLFFAIPSFAEPTHSTKMLSKKQTAEFSGNEKEYFDGPLTLKETIKLFLEKNPTIQSATHNKTAIEHERNQTRSEFLPSLDVSSAFGRQQSNRYNKAKRGTGAGQLGATTPRKTKSTRNGSELSFAANQNLFNGLASFGQYRRQSARISSAAHRIDSQKEFNGLAAAQAFFQTLQQRDLLNISEWNLKKHVTTYKKIEERTKAGTSNYAELNKAKARLELARSAYYTTLRSLQDVEANFQALVGIPPQKLEKNNSIPLDLLPATIEEAIARAREHNPSLLALNDSIAAAKHNIMVQSAGFYPQLDLQFTGSRTQDKFGFKGINRTIEGKAVARYNLFQGGRDWALRKEALGRYNEAKTLYEEEHLAVENEIRSAWALFQETKVRIPILKDYIYANKRVRDLYIEQFSLGQRSLLNVLDAQNELFQSRREKITAEAQHYFSAYRIIATMGGLMGALDLS